MNAPARPIPLPEPLLHKALAIRGQRVAFSLRRQLAQSELRLIDLEEALMTQNIQTVEAELLSALHAPEGARFDWNTLTFTENDDGTDAPVRAER
jgi:hypothetical protein